VVEALTLLAGHPAVYTCTRRLSQQQGKVDSQVVVREKPYLEDL
jgi:hypothetical protein